MHGVRGATAVGMSLSASRRCAIDFLEAMTGRHNEDVATHLRKAVAAYGQQIERLMAMEIGHEEIVDPGSGREAMAELIRTAAALDSRAKEMLERTVAAMGG